jgi:hypothetical protein
VRPNPPQLPADYRIQIEQHLLEENHAFRDLVISYSDPVRVRLHDPASSQGEKEAVAVLLNYTPHAADGSIYFMIIQAAALFEGNSYLGERPPVDPSIEWIEGRPSPHEDKPTARQKQAARRLQQATDLADPLVGPIVRRRIQRDLWVRYTPAFEEMHLPADTIAKARSLLEACELAAPTAQLAALHQGMDDPFSAAMGQAVTEAQAKAEHTLRTFLGANAADRLEFLAKAFAGVVGIERNEGLDLLDAGLPLSSAQALALAEIYEKPRHAIVAGTGAGTSSDPFWSDVATVLSSAQLEIVQRFTTDRSTMATRNNTVGATHSSTLIDDPTYGSIFRRQIRRRLLWTYRAGLSELGLSSPAATQAIDLLQKRDVARLAAEGAAEAKNAARAAVAAAGSEAWDKVSGELQSQLGAENYRRLESFAEFAQFQLRVSQNEAAALGVAGCPLSGSQLHTLQLALWNSRHASIATERTVPSQPPNATQHRSSAELSAADATLLQKTAEFLSTSQQEALKIYLLDQTFFVERVRASAL